MDETTISALICVLSILRCILHACWRASVLWVAPAAFCICTGAAVVVTISGNKYGVKIVLFMNITLSRLPDADSDDVENNRI